MAHVNGTDGGEKSVLTKRASGILLHPTSLPGPYGIGELGPDAFRFADTLSRMNQSYWQVLPLGPTGYGNSPYQSSSTFAGNTLLISLKQLVDEGLLLREELAEFPPLPSEYTDYAAVIPARQAMFSKAAAQFDRRAPAALHADFGAFREEQAWWLDDYALYRAIKRAHNEKPWIRWPRPLAARDPSALAAAAERLDGEIRAEKVLQFLLHRQWDRLHACCRERGIDVVGDLPIFVAHDSADVWTQPHLFQLDEHGRLRVQAGVPPDYFSETGQLWGNPLYRWDVHRDEGYGWWVQRMRAILEWVDIVRIDHFRGFVAHWEVSGHARTAKHGHWAKGPGEDLFEVLLSELGSLPIIAEDLGVITDEVKALRGRFGLPGMRVLQFAFGADPKAGAFRPASFPGNCVVYTGTHDNNTTVGWYHGKPEQGSTRTPTELEQERRAIEDYFGAGCSRIQWAMIAEVLGSNANTAMVPLQDLLGLGTEARMNLPGTSGGNWQWRFTWDMLPRPVIKRMALLTQDTGRIGRL